MSYNNNNAGMRLVYLTYSEQKALASSIPKHRKNKKRIYRSRGPNNVEEWYEAWENRGYISAKPSNSAKNKPSKNKKSKQNLKTSDLSKTIHQRKKKKQSHSKKPISEFALGNEPRFKKIFEEFDK